MTEFMGATKEHNENAFLFTHFSIVDWCFGFTAIGPRAHHRALLLTRVRSGHAPIQER